MRKRVTSLALVLVIASGVCAGMPLHSSEEECNMPEMAGMDCCKKAAQHDRVTSEGLMAQLCCSLNCAQDGTTGSTSTQLPRPSVVQVAVDRPSWTQTSVASQVSDSVLSWA